MSPTASDMQDKVRIELPRCILEKLILSGMLSGDECRCLDSDAKQALWQSLLISSIR